MKKLALVMICTLLIVVFIAFNYLLWDRENKEKDIENLERLRTSSSTSIDTLGRKIKELEDENNFLKDRMNELETSNRLLEHEKKRLGQDKTDIGNILDRKLEIIDVLKQHADLKPLEEIAVKWVEDIDQGDYTTAYELMQKQPSNPDGFSDVDNFTASYKNTVKNIKIISLELCTEGIPDNKRGNIIFKADLEVQLVNQRNSAPKVQFNEGVNEVFFIFDYDKKTGQWMIANISPTLS
jgi:cell division protein FtsB